MVRYWCLSANKFLQKFGILTYQISKRKRKNKIQIEDKFTKTMNYINKIDTAINNFRFNVSIAIFMKFINF